MWEFCLVCEDEAESQYLFDKLSKRLKKYKGVITIYNKKLLFAYSAPEAKNIVKIEIINYILEKYKNCFFNRKISDINLEEIKRQALIKVLSLFDNAYDAKYIAGIFEPVGTIVLDSYIRFYLKDLIKKWNDIVNLILNNSFYLFCSDTYSDLLKFLLNTLDTKWSEVNIIMDNDKIIILDKKFKNCLLKEVDELVVLTELIGFSPEKINIYCSAIVDNSILSSILDIFDGIVNILPLEKLENYKKQLTKVLK